MSDKVLIVSDEEIKVLVVGIQGPTGATGATGATGTGIGDHEATYSHSSYDSHISGDGSDHSEVSRVVGLADAYYWRDIDFPIIIRTTGPGIPTLQTLQGNITAPQWQVNDYNVCEGQEFVHEWIEGTTCYWHCHIITNGSDLTDRYVRFEVEYTIADLNGVLSSAQTITSSDIVISAGTATKTHIIASIGSFTPASLHIAAHVYARLKRVASVGAAPSNDPWCTMLQMHVQIDGRGSTQMTSK